MYRYVMMAGVVALSACSGSGPSASEIQALMQAQEQHTEITKVEKVNCVDATEGRYRCTFAVTGKSGNWERTHDMSRLFEKQPSGWAVAGE